MDVLETLVPYFADRYEITLTAPTISWTRGGYQGPKTRYRPGERVVSVREEFSYSYPEVVSRLSYHLGEQAVDENTPLGEWQTDGTDDRLLFETTNEVAREFQREGLTHVLRSADDVDPLDRASLYARAAWNGAIGALAASAPSGLAYRRPLRANGIDVAEFFRRPRETYVDLLEWRRTGAASLLGLWRTAHAGICAPSALAGA